MLIELRFGLFRIDWLLGVLLGYGGFGLLCQALQFLTRRSLNLLDLFFDLGIGRHVHLRHLDKRILVEFLSHDFSHDIDQIARNSDQFVLLVAHTDRAVLLLDLLRPKRFLRICRAAHDV